MKRHGLLIVDDEKEILRSLTLTFADDYDVFVASGGAEALEVLKQQEIVLIIADQRMPEMTGVELLEQILQMILYYPHHLDWLYRYRLARSGY